MIIETALQKAILYEKKIAQIYEKAAQQSLDSRGREIFELLAKEERDHVAYLTHKWEVWQAEKELSSTDLQTALAHAKHREHSAESVAATLSPAETQQELALLEMARNAEAETSQYYEELITSLPVEGQTFFRRFLEIEQAHLDLVQFEIDSLTRSGFWMGIQEFDMEAID